jgi:hypothetical protein
LGHGLSEAKNLSAYSLQDTPTGPAHKVKPAVSKTFNRPRLAVKTGRGRGVAARELPETRGINPLNDTLPFGGAQESPLDLTRGILPTIEYLKLDRGTNSISVGANSHHSARIEATTGIIPFR